MAIATMVPSESFRPKLKASLITGELRTSEAARKSPAGRKPWDEVVIFKALVLQALYNLSDDQVEYQLRDRLSFMRFLGLGIEDAVPDAKTLWLYREAPGKAGAVEELFDLFDAYLKDKGYLAMASAGSKRFSPKGEKDKRGGARPLRAVFGNQKNGMGAELVRTSGIVRARCKIGMTNLVYNIRRFVCLERLTTATA